MKTRQFRKSLPLILIFLAGLVLFTILIALNQRIPGSDDTVFQTQTLPYHTVIEWVSYRYQTWSGRIFSEAGVYFFSSAPLVLWKIVTVTMYALFVGVLFKYYKLSQPKASLKQDGILLTLFLALPFLIDKSVLAEGGLWVTGSIVYFWMTTLGMLAFYPVISYVIKGMKPHLAISVIGLIAGVIAASSQEQVGAVLLVLTLVLVAWIYVTKKIIPWYLIIFSVIIVISLKISLFAPGNDARLHAEVATWLPDFYTTSLTERIVYGYRWLLEAFINHGGFLLAGIWGTLAALFYIKPQRDRLDRVFTTTLLIGGVVVLTNGFDATSYLFNFYSEWKLVPPSMLSTLNLIPWGIMLVATVVAPLILFRKQPVGYLLSILLTASIVSALILLLSPTMYASLWRALFVPSSLLIIVLSILIARLITKKPKYGPAILAIVLSLGVIHYVYQVVRLVNNFY